ncbi:MAG: PAS domain-containing protein [Bacteroidia bacterium]
MKAKLTNAEKHLINKLHEKEHFIEEVANSTADIIYVLDLQKRKVIYANKRAASLLSIDNRNLDLIHPEDQPARARHLSSCFRLKCAEVKEMDLRMKANNERWQWFRVRDKVFKFDQSGNVAQIIGVVQNIEEKKNYEEELLNRNILLENLLNAPALGIAVCKTVRDANNAILDYQFCMVSNTFEKLYGQLLKGKMLFGEFPAARISEEQRLSEVVNSGISHEMELPIELDGVPHWFHVRYMPFGDGFISVFNEITLRKAAVDQVQAQAALIRELVHRGPCCN